MKATSVPTWSACTVTRWPPYQSTTSTPNAESSSTMGK